MIKVFFLRLIIAQKAKKNFYHKKKLLSLQIKVFFFEWNFHLKNRQKRRNEVSRIWDFWDLPKIENKWTIKKRNLSKFVIFEKRLVYWIMLHYIVYLYFFGKNDNFNEKWPKKEIYQVKKGLSLICQGPLLYRHKQ